MQNVKYTWYFTKTNGPVVAFDAIGHTKGIHHSVRDRWKCLKGHATLIYNALSYNGPGQQNG